ncbi:MAG TPA: hypothetical protein GXX75_24035 [Clostridiales bacterium]|nr:hypothetical protein [Clostridiales bacterium]
MEYVKHNCPKCNGELQVPVNLENCICMYCGEAIQLDVKKKVDLTGVPVQKVEANYRESLADIPQLLGDMEQMLPRFAINKYSDCFYEYERKCTPLLLPAEQYASLSEENCRQVAEELAGFLVNWITEGLATKSNKKKTPKSTQIDQYRFFFTVYLVPMVRHLNYEISEPFADALIAAWIRAYPKYPFQKSEFDRLLAGFRRKAFGFCFITTAVCDTLQKEDDCYELMAFRHFRDTYMLEKPEGRELVEEYYRVAPVIVTSINMEPQAGQTYQGIWTQYLQPCLKAIEEKNYCACEEQYTRMVEELKEKYYCLNI